MTDWADLVEVMTASGPEFVHARNRFLTERTDLVDTVASRGLRLHGGRLPTPMTRDDLLAESGLALLHLLNTLRLHGTNLPLGWGRADHGDMAVRTRTTPATVLEQTRVGAGNVAKFLVQWGAPLVRAALEDNESDVTGHRRRLKLFKAQTELTGRLGRDATLDEAADWANTANAHTYGVAEATRHPEELAIARPCDIDPARIVWRDRTVRRLCQEVTAAQPAAAAGDRKALVSFNRSRVAEHGLLVCAEEGLLARPTDLLPGPAAQQAREAESAAIRCRVTQWGRAHPTYSHLDAATTYTIDRVTALGVRKLRSTSGYLSPADYLAGDPLLVDPADPATANLFGAGDLLPGIQVAALREAILSRLTTDHGTGPILMLAWEWLDACSHGLSVQQNRANAHELGFTTRNELIGALHTVRDVAREIATALLTDDSS